MTATPNQLYAADQARMDHSDRDEVYRDFAVARGLGNLVDEACHALHRAEVSLQEHKRWQAHTQYLLAAAAFDKLAREYHLLAMRDAEAYWREQRIDAVDSATGIYNLITGRVRKGRVR